MIEVIVPLPQAYAALVERGGLARAGERLLPALGARRRVFIVTTPPVWQLWGVRLEAGLAAGGIAAAVIAMPDGEPHKTLASLERLSEELAGHGADREAVVLAFGGGMVGDVAAFLASIYMRGIALIQVPTTLVAMVDSSLGGKTAVNLEAGKNLLGTFHHPLVILADPELLATLPGREYRSGLAEAIKYGIIRDRALFEFIEARTAALAERAPEVLEPLIAACLRHKAEVVAGDEREADGRRILNYGHTLGHALESATAYQHFLHGEAVAWGMIAAGRIAVRLGRCDDAAARRMERAILAVCGPLPAISSAPEEILRFAARDKKARAGVLNFVLPTAIGAVEVVGDVPDQIIRAALADTITMAPAPGTR